MGSISFEYLGVAVRVRGSESELAESVIEQIRLDFSAFQSAALIDSISAISRIEIKILNQRAPFFRLSLFSTRFTPRYRFFPRQCRHSENTQSSIRRLGRVTEVSVFGSDRDEIREVVFVIIVSLLGWELEKLGYIRCHAASIDDGQSVSLLQLPSGSGKSGIALETLRMLPVGWNILGDEVAIINSHLAFSFPIGIAASKELVSALKIESKAKYFKRAKFKGKYIVPIPEPKSKRPLGRIIFQYRPGRPGQLRAPTILDSLKWLFSTALGLGLPQMREFILRFEECPWVIRIFFRRLSFCFSILKLRQLQVSYEPASFSSDFEPRLQWLRDVLSKSTSKSKIKAAKI